jgi:hypothetical protein
MEISLQRLKPSWLFANLPLRNHDYEGEHRQDTKGSVEFLSEMAAL